VYTQLLRCTQQRLYLALQRTQPAAVATIVGACVRAGGGGGTGEHASAVSFHTSVHSRYHNWQRLAVKGSAGLLNMKYMGGG
jgi:hypothetical protein